MNMTGESVEYQQQSKAIYRGLKSVLTEEEAQLALEKWREYFNAHGSVFSGINVFAKDICDALGKSGQHRMLVRSLNRALITQQSDVSGRADAAAKPAVAEAKVSTEAGISSPEFDTFKSLLTSLLTHVGSYRAGLSVRSQQYLLEVIESLPWSEQQQLQAIGVIQFKPVPLARSYRLEQLKSLITHFRAWLKEEVGASAAEQLIKRAMDDTEQTMMALHFSPKEFF